MNAAIATFFLAHLIADYPLQTNWMVQAKRTWSGLTLHVTIHLATLLVLCLPDLPRLWPFIVALGLAHFAIDAFKNLVMSHRPRWVIGPYIFDQFLHILSIWLIAYWADSLLAGGWPIDRPWQIYAAGFLLATKVWYITERVLFYADEGYQYELFRQQWPRMAARALMLALLLSIGRLNPASTMLPATLALFPYGTRVYGRRALLIDATVAAVVAVLVWLVT
jgi:hypothetical protein